MRKKSQKGRRLMRDDDGHFYLVPVEAESLFYDSLEHDRDILFMEKFEEFRIDGPHCLTIYDWEEK